MTQDQQPALPTPSPKTAALLRSGAVLAASGPVILTAFGIGRQTVGWFCAPPPYHAGENSYPLEDLYAFEGPYSLAGPYRWSSYAPDDLPGKLLFWVVLLLPIIVAGPMPSRRLGS